MKFIASILCIYLFCLHIQPALFPLKMKEEKVKSCCAKKDNAKKDCSDDGCCDKNSCNPFFSLCPICAASAVTVKQYTLPQSKPFYYSKQVFFSKDTQLTSQYTFDLLRPPQLV